MLRRWRARRKLSQLELAIASGVSQRQISFLETGRSVPQQDTVLRLSSALDVPLRHQNVLLAAGGFAPIFRSSGLDDRDLAPVRQAIDFMLRQHEPYPALVVDRQWNVLMSNTGAGRLTAFLLGPERAAAMGAGRRPLNLLRMLFDPDGLRPLVANWDEVATILLRRLEHEAALGLDQAAALLRELQALGEPSPRDGDASWYDTSLPVLPIEYRKQGRNYPFFSAITTVGTPLDVTAQELRVESFFPAGHAAEELIRALAKRQTGNQGSPEKSTCG